MYISEELYPNEFDGEGTSYSIFYISSSYQPIIDYLGEEVLIQVDDDSYQGDSRIIYHGPGEKYGYLQFGWGSCSGCDALQACESHQEVDELIQELKDSIKWFDSLSELQEYFKNHDWEGDYSWFSEEQQEFVERVLNFSLF